jgi:hypothetical protein
LPERAEESQLAKIKDPKTGEERDETPEEIAAREAAEAEGAEGDDENDEPSKPAERAEYWKKRSRDWEKKSRENWRTVLTLRTRVKELEPQAKKLKEIEDQAKTDGQKAEEARKAAEGETAKATSELLKLRVAMRKGLTEAQTKRLVGTTEEELEADADELLESFGGSTEDRTTITRLPKEKLKPGARNTEREPKIDPKKVVDEVMART